MRGDDERLYPPGTVPAFVAVLGIAVGIALFCATLVRSCIPEPVQMIPSPVVHSTATASAQVVATQSVRVTIRTANSSQKHAETMVDTTEKLPRTNTLDPHYDKRPGWSTSSQVNASNVTNSGQVDEIIIDVDQAIAGRSTSNAEATSTIDPNRQTSFDSSHGRLGVALLTMPGVLAADLQLLSLDVSPATLWLVDVDMEIGADLAGNTEAGAVGVTAGSKVFGGVYYWGRWNLSAQGVALGAGIRF